MASIDFSPAILNLTGLTRDNGHAFKLTLTEGGVAMTLPTTGWRAQIRQRAGQSTEPPLASFTIDASQAASGILHLSVAGPDLDNLPKKCRWDLENTVLDRTFFAGDFIPGEQVTQ